MWKTWSLSYDFVYRGKQFISADNNWYLPANYISNTTLSTKIKLKERQQVGLSFSVKNIFNQQYHSIAWRPMPGRNYVIKLRFLLN